MVEIRWNFQLRRHDITWKPVRGKWRLRSRVLALMAQVVTEGSYCNNGPNQADLEWIFEDVLRIMINNGEILVEEEQFGVKTWKNYTITFDGISAMRRYEPLIGNVRKSSEKARTSQRLVAQQ
jgi:hypothetical protein